MHGRDSQIRRRKSADERLIRDYATELQKHINVEALAVFGSRACGETVETSDYDLVVVSDDFTRMSRLDRTCLLLDYWPGKSALESIGYDPDEFRRATGLLVWDILEEAVVFLDTGIFGERRRFHDRQKEQGALKRIPGGWQRPA